MAARALFKVLPLYYCNPNSVSAFWIRVSPISVAAAALEEEEKAASRSLEQSNSLVSASLLISYHDNANSL